MDSKKILNEILSFFLKNKLKSCPVEQIIIPGQYQYQILDIIQNLPAIFQILKDDKSWLIKIHFNVFF